MPDRAIEAAMAATTTMMMLMLMMMMMRRRRRRKSRRRRRMRRRVSSKDCELNHFCTFDKQSLHLALRVLFCGSKRGSGLEGKEWMNVMVSFVCEVI